MSLERLAENYYTAQEAQRKLGMTKDRFDYWVKKGRIKKSSIGGVHGVFAKERIDELAREIEALMLADLSMDIEFRQATPDDMDAENNLAYLNFGERARNPETCAARRRFLEVNPDVTYHLYDHNRLAASINFVPIKHTAALEFKEGKRGWLFTNDMIEQFTPDHPLECIIIDMMTLTTVPPSKRKRYGYILLDHMARRLQEWGKQGIEITKVYACGGTEDGRRILENAGFTKLGEKAPNRVIYELDVQSSNLHLLQAYKEALATWKQQQQ